MLADNFSPFNKRIRTISVQTIEIQFQLEKNLTHNETLTFLVST